MEHRTRLSLACLAAFLSASCVTAAEMPGCFSCADDELQKVEGLASGTNSALSVQPADDGKIPFCSGEDDDTWTVLVNGPTTRANEGYVCAKIVSEDGYVGRGAIANNKLASDFGWEGEDKSGCQGGLTYNDVEATKGKLCVCSTDRCNGATGVQISLTLAAIMFAITRFFA